MVLHKLQPSFDISEFNLFDSSYCKLDIHMPLCRQAISVDERECSDVFEIKSILWTKQQFKCERIS